ncbi:MAG: sulfotransferase family 2 domain-containing protein [Flavobacteriales bacterium]|nr:sulfotransferase family 2 domain-containing protein [Flavobacteriales bacterium]
MNIQSVPKKIPGITNIHIMHIGKTGGRVVEEAILGNELTNKCKIHYLPFKARLYHIKEGEKIIIFIREPLDRFLSGFESRQSQDNGESHWSPPEKSAFEWFPTANDLAEAISDDDEIVKSRANYAMTHIYHVSTSIYKWIRSDEYFEERLSDIVIIANHARFEADFDRIKEYTGLGDEIKLNQELIEAPFNLNEKLSDKAIRNLEAWFKKDIEFYNKWKNGK